MKWIKKTYQRCIPLCFGVCYSLHKTNWRLVTSIWQGPGDFRGARICGEGRNTSSPKIACVGGYEEVSSCSEVSNFKCKLVGKRNSGHRYWTKARLASRSGTNGSIWWENYEAFFETISQRGKGGFPLGLELKNLQRIWISAKKRHSCCDWSRTLPHVASPQTSFGVRLYVCGEAMPHAARSKWPAFTSFYEESNRHQNIVEYIAGKSFVFISLKENLDSALFIAFADLSIIFLIWFLSFNGLLKRDTGAFTRHLWYVNYFTPFPRNVSLGRLCCRQF